MAVWCPTLLLNTDSFNYREVLDTGLPNRQLTLAFNLKLVALAVAVLAGKSRGGAGRLPRLVGCWHATWLVGWLRGRLGAACHMPSVQLLGG